MTVLFRLDRTLRFPDPALAEPNGLLACGGDLSVERLLLGYRMGIFPWYSEGQPILWWSPDPRFVLPVAELEVPRSLGKRIRQRPYRITLDQAFPEVLLRCARAPRPGQAGTWITPAMYRAYVRLHDLGHAHSVEAWEGATLVGGLYGVGLGALFSGESMFAERPDASKIAFVHLVRQLARWGTRLVDCQVHTDHLARFGAREVPRPAYLAEIATLVPDSLPGGRWAFDADFECTG